MKIINDLKQPVLIACNDAGSANIIAHWIKDLSGNDFIFHLGGPAVKIFKKHVQNFKNLPLKQAIKDCNSLISGTGWASCLEHDARIEAKIKNIKSVAVIDHWVNYEKRFMFNDTTCFPNEIWVTDKYAFEIASNTFNNIKIKLLENIYLKNEIEKILSYRSQVNLNEKDNIHILYVLEPIIKKWMENETCSGEFQALEFFKNNLHYFCENPKNCVIYLKTHPSENHNKYDEWILKNSHLQIQLLPINEELNKSISRSHWVVGCNTFAMVIALKAKIKVASTIPKYGPKCDLPYKEIVKIRDLKIENKSL
jgi:hypothetical protein